MTSNNFQVDVEEGLEGAVPETQLTGSDGGGLTQDRPPRHTWGKVKSSEAALDVGAGSGVLDLAGEEVLRRLDLDALTAEEKGGPGHTPRRRSTRHGQ